MSMVDRVCGIIFWSITGLALILGTLGVVWTAQGVDDLWVAWMTAVSLFWLGLIVWANCQDDRQGRRY